MARYTIVEGSRLRSRYQRLRFLERSRGKSLQAVVALLAIWAYAILFGLIAAAATAVIDASGINLPFQPWITLTATAAVAVALSDPLLDYVKETK